MRDSRPEPAIVVLRAGPNAESPADFDELVAQLKADMRPLDVVERGLVMRIATAMWRMRRAYRYEVGAIGELVSAAEAAGPADPQVCKLDRAIGNAKSEVDLWRYFLARAQTNPAPEDKRKPFAKDCKPARSISAPCGSSARS